MAISKTAAKFQSTLPALVLSLAATASQLAVQFAQLAVVANCFDAGVASSYALALTIITPISLAANLQLRQLRVSDPSKTRTTSDYLTVRLASGVLSCALLWAIQSCLNTTLETAGIGYLLLAVKSADGFAEIFYGEYQRNETFVYIAVSQIMRCTVSLSAFLVAVRMSGSIQIALMTQLVVSSIWVCTVDSYVRTKYCETQIPNIKASWRRIYVLSLIALPFGFISLSQAMALYWPRLLLEATSADGALMSIAVATVPISMITVGTGALHQSIFREASRAWHDKNRSAFFGIGRYQTVVSTVIAASAAILIWGVGDYVMPFFFTSKYTDSSLTALFALSVVLGSLGSTSSLVVVCSQSSWHQSISNITGLVVNVALCALLVPSLNVKAIPLAEAARVLVVVGMNICVARVISDSHFTMASMGASVDVASTRQAAA